MVDCEFVNIEKISNEERVKIINYVMEKKGVRARDLEVTINLISMIRSGKRRVTEDLLCRALKFLSNEELAKLLGQIPEVEPASINDVIRVIARARADPGFREILLSYLDRYLGDYVRSMDNKWIVSEQDIEEFVKAKHLKGLTDKTIRYEVRYIRRALAELNWVLTPDGIREYLSELVEEGETYVIRHTTASLKSFLKEVLKTRDPALFSLLYNSFTVVRPKNHNRVRLPTIDQLRQIWQGLPTIEARLYFTILAECGLRPSEPFLINMDDVDLEHGVIHISKVTETKRAFIAFLRPEVIDWVKREYLLRREFLVRTKLTVIKADNLGIGTNAEDWARRFIPFDRDRLRREIKDVARQVLGRDFELYELRKFFATHMISQGVPESIVNTLQGRAPPSEFRVLIEHYWSPRHEELRQWYIKYAPRVCC
ncbi:MAG: tyrosine-type recombinase/integrase [Vulcanisaeta sp.]